MKCQKCDKPATFHITEMIGSKRVELHLCERHANEYLHQAENGSLPDPGEETVAEAGLHETKEDLLDLDYKVCPVCGRSFQEFRKTGRIGCPYDYDFFAEQIDPLLVGIHGTSQHSGHRPPRECDLKWGFQMIRLRAELDDAVNMEDYERAGQLRDQIRALATTEPVGP
ncbi:MAG: UvrB/UvrC motif-containing protein [Thermoguttaceae bacterium]|nr:UvrB/UvrC motif-containing protein [Thermoguttaceae bacterium]